MKTTPIRNQGNTIEMRMIAPIIEDAVLVIWRRESVARSIRLAVGRATYKPPSKLSIVSMSVRKRVRSSRFQPNGKMDTFGETIHYAAKRLRKMGESSHRTDEILPTVVSKKDIGACMTRSIASWGDH